MIVLGKDPLLLLVDQGFPVLEIERTVQLQVKNLILNICLIPRNLNCQNDSTAGSVAAETSLGCKQFCVYCLLFPCVSASCFATSCSTCPKVGPKTLNHQHFWRRPCTGLLGEQWGQRQGFVTWGGPWAIRLEELAGSPCSWENACHKNKM